ncbi:O-antigen ligase family protein [Hymenobacter persicinus]|uniref:O-antigen ligase-related domain-containing protein n=1 Tax=Hymenobacter persicinus TaxID=2025506 RepID=A0A4Q5LEX7_9BACT|nr:O-antigen ligase family protein [Hymenobacter persicinus]RYU82889.1 hypothetical protein EWM57_04145 [Hymenobacter persicinus]
MKISLRFLYLLPVLGVIFKDRAFNEFVFTDEGSPVLAKFGMLLLGVALTCIVLYYRYMERLMKRWLWLTLAVIGALSLESYAGWQSWFVYPHVFGKLLVLLHIFGVYAFHRRFGLPPFDQLMALVFFGLLASLVIYHPDALSVSAFLDNDRGFGSTEAMLLLLPTLYYLNQYLTRGGLLRLVLFFAGALLIVFLQHRSVWVSMGAALVLNIVLLVFGRVEGARLTPTRLLPMALLPLIGLISGGLVVLSDPKISRKLERSVQDIMHPDKQGTGSWRLQQFEAYEPFMLEYPVAGMRLDGFELPVQFYTLASDGGENEQVWEDGTGHHFHSFYVDRIFYFGLLGLLLTLLVPLVLLIRRLRHRVPLPPTTATLIIYCLSSLVYSISYDWPLYMFGLWGLSLAAAAAPAWQAVRVPAPPPSLDLVPSPFQPFPVPSNVHSVSTAPRA